MSELNILMIVMTAMIAIAIVLILILRNRMDRKKLNPDATNSVEEVHMDQNRSHDHM